MVLSLHSIIVEYERVILRRLVKGFDSKINEHCEKSCLLEASEELRARLITTKEDPIDSPEMKREAQRAEGQRANDMTQDLLVILELCAQSEGNTDTGERLLPIGEKSNSACGMGL